MTLSMHAIMKRFRMRVLHNGYLFLITLLLTACGGSDDDGKVPDDYKQKMRDLVQGISAYARASKSNFIVIPQNGQELVTTNGQSDGPVATPYLNAIDGVGREDLFYGYAADDAATPTSEQEYMTEFLDVCEKNNIQVLTTDYCSTHAKMDDSYSKNNKKGYISFAAPSRELNVVPDYPAAPFNENNKDIVTLKDAQNFLYFINTDNLSKENFITAVKATNYDAIIMDLFVDKVAFTASEIAQLKVKKNGGARLVICYMSIGEAEDYRYYWNSKWAVGNPTWLREVNPDWPGNYKVKYWEKEWQDIIYGNDNSYTKKILSAGFDGVYLDIIDAFEYFE